MKNWKTEYKILFFIGCVFVATLIFYLIQSGSFSRFFINLKKDDYMTCTEQNYVNGFSYTEYRCSIRDDQGNSYTLSYPQIHVESEDIQTLNKRLKSNFDNYKENIIYNSKSNKIELNSYSSINYAIYSDSKMVSVLVSQEKIENTEFSTSSSRITYNFSKETGKQLSEREVKALYSINLDFSSNLRAKVIKMYASDFGYNYYVTNSRNQKFDESIESVTLSNIQNIFVTQDGEICFFINLYNPTYFQNIRYQVTVDTNNEIELKIAS